MGLSVPPLCLSAHSAHLRVRSSDRLDRIGLQLYTLRRELARDFTGTLAAVAAIGYQEVEFAGYFGRKPAEVKAAVEQAGLRAPAAHVPISSLRRDWNGALEQARIVGHEYLVVAWIPVEERRTLDGYRRIAGLFNRAGAEARGAGITFAYHNHDFELAPIDGRLPLDVLLQETDPKDVAFEMDLYWITKGGGDPLAYFARHPGRFPLVHVKDSRGAPRHIMADVGSGIINFRRVFAQRARAGFRHFLVEHDEPADPFASIRASLDYLKRLEF